MLKHCVPGCLLARKNAAAPIMETQGTESDGFGVSAKGAWLPLQTTSGSESTGQVTADGK